MQPRFWEEKSLRQDEQWQWQKESSIKLRPTTYKKDALHICHYYMGKGKHNNVVVFGMLELVASNIGLRATDQNQCTAAMEEEDITQGKWMWYNAGCDQKHSSWGWQHDVPCATLVKGTHDDGNNSQTFSFPKMTEMIRFELLYPNRTHIFYPESREYNNSIPFLGIHWPLSAAILFVNDASTKISDGILWRRRRYY